VDPLAAVFFLLAAASLPPALDALGRWRRASAFRPGGVVGQRPRRLLVLIPARAEGTLMLPLCRDLAREAEAADVRLDLLVVLDGADPAVEAALLAESIPFLVKKVAGPSKGRALAFATESLLVSQPDLLTAADFVMVFDADMRLDEGFFTKLAVPEGTVAFQLPVRPAGVPAPGPARVEAFSLAVATRVEDLARDVEALPVRLRGKAMGFSPGAWREGPATAHRTTAEDSEATLRLLGRDLRIRALSSPAAFDEASGDARAMARPRARWFGGHLKLLAVGAPDLMRLAALSPRAAFVLAADLWLRPRAFVLCCLLLVAVGSDAALVALSLTGHGGSGAALLPAFLASVVSKAGLVFEGFSGLAARVVLGYPAEIPPVRPADVVAFLGLWARAVGRAIRAPGAWHRARPEG
jgi:hypothetical protein